MAESKGILPSENVNTLGNAKKKWENVYSNKFNGLTLEKSVPANALFTDTTYEAATQKKDGLLSASDKKKLDKVTMNSDGNLFPNQLRPPLQRSAVYAKGDIAFHDSLPSWAYLECTQAGTTSESEPTFGGGQSS